MADLLYFSTTVWLTGSWRARTSQVMSSLCSTLSSTIESVTATSRGHWHPKSRTPTNLQSRSFHIYVEAMSWTSRTKLQRAGGLILLDKQPLSTQFLEGERKTTRDGCKTYFKDLQNPSFYPRSLSLSIPRCHHFIRPLSAPFRGEGGKKGGNGLLDLNLPSREFQRDDMQPQR